MKKRKRRRPSCLPRPASSCAWECLWLMGETVAETGCWGPFCVGLLNSLEKALAFRFSAFDVPPHPPPNVLGTEPRAWRMLNHTLRLLLGGILGRYYTSDLKLHPRLCNSLSIHRGSAVQPHSPSRSKGRLSHFWLLLYLPSLLLKIPPCPTQQAEDSALAHADYPISSMAISP